MTGITLISLQWGWAHSEVQRGLEGMQMGNMMWKIRKMKGRATEVCIAICKVLHREKEGCGGKEGERGWFSPHTLRFRSALEIFRCLFLSFSRFLSRSSSSDSRTFLMEAAAWAILERKTPAPRKPFSPHADIQVIYFSCKGTGCKPELHGVIHSSLSGTPEKVTALPQPLQHP